MIDKIANPAAINASASKMIDMPGLESGKNESFSDILRKTAVESINTMRGGEAATAKAISGDASLPEVVGAITASEITLQTVMAVRDKMVGAYQEIMRMPV